MLSELVNSLKGVSSWRVRREFPGVARHYHRANDLWSGSYVADGVGGAPISQVREWDGGCVAICVPERWMIGEVESRLTKAEITSCSIGTDGPRLVEAPVHVATMHRFKGLEYQRMIIAGVSEGLVPAWRILAHEDHDPLRFRWELQQARSLLLVASTRARDSIVISWHGPKSRFLP